MGIGGGQAEDIGSQLHGGLALAAAACDADFFDGYMRLLAGAFGAFTQGVGQPFQDGAVKVGAGMHIAKTDDGTLGFGTGNLETRATSKAEGSTPANRAEPHSPGHRTILRFPHRAAWPAVLHSCRIHV